VEREFAGIVNAWRITGWRASFSTSRGPGRRDAGRHAHPLQLTHEELSNLIGTTRETVTILLGKFEEMGIIRRQSRRIIVDRPRLAEYAHIAEG